MLHGGILMKSSSHNLTSNPIKAGLLLLLPIVMVLTGCPSWFDFSSNIPVTAIVISSANEIYTISTAGGTLQLSATATPTDASDKTVTWSVSSGSTFATVSSTGLVTAVADGTATIKALANDDSGKSATKEITISGQASVIDPTPSVAAPTASVAAGNIVIGRQVMLSTTTTGSTIRYTLDGTEPSATSTAYAVGSPIEIVNESITLKAKAFKEGMSDSATSSYTYSLVNGFTVTTDGIRRSILEGVPGSAVAPLDLQAYGPLFGTSGDKDVLIFACKDSFMSGTVTEPSLLITILFDYSSVYDTYQSMLQFAVPMSDLASLPATLTAESILHISFNGNYIDLDDLAAESGLTIASLGAVGQPISGSFAISGTDASNETFDTSGLFRVLRGGNVPMTLGTSTEPQALCTGMSIGSNATDGSTSYYRIPVADCAYSVIIIPTGGMSQSSIPDTTILINGDSITDAQYENEMWAGAIHETDGYFDFHITDDMTSDVAGAAYMIMLSEIYADTDAFLARYDENDNTDYDDVSPGTLAVIGDGTLGTYTTADLMGMLGYNNNYITSAQGISSDDEVLYGLSDATGEYIFAVHRSSSGDSWSVSTITEGVYNFMAEQDPYYIP